MANNSFSGIEQALRYLSRQFTSVENDAEEWKDDRVELQETYKALQLERATQDQLHMELLLRISMLEYALCNERSNYMKKPSVSSRTSMELETHSSMSADTVVGESKVKRAIHRLNSITSPRSSEKIPSPQNDPSHYKIFSPQNDASSHTIRTPEYSTPPSTPQNVLSHQDSTLSPRIPQHVKTLSSESPYTSFGNVSSPKELPPVDPLSPNPMKDLTSTNCFHAYKLKMKITGHLVRNLFFLKLFKNIQMVSIHRMLFVQ